MTVHAHDAYNDAYADNDISHPTQTELHNVPVDVFNLEQLGTTWNNLETHENQPVRHKHGHTGL